ncbi:hypothetical protein P2A78_20815 [Xanthomonas perforans]|uniref:Uncharacterized protein n=1 Tax=Xanthomonas hortorum pv. gardneri TaxID=2754056 RepID=A0A6V7FI67_9XANT|nr:MULTISPECIES: hypothetical protein [Xanthomonas]MBD1532308.1 hypothetical protein [Xanthomonas citri pv. citri]MBD4081498.1 hypothetical protein [Xanthomonas citri pv. citri]MBD4392476.1 hypothetical protein [Xanthomonas citri pv. citri]MBD4400186.1 hypothetical protein [Xanthomonas citri pv. citri]MBD4402630.1 hypothetical protein [Xanthomonas citri pv. citri]
MPSLDWSQFSPLDHLIALALIVGWVVLTCLLASLAINLALRVFSLVVGPRSGNRSP